MSFYKKLRDQINILNAKAQASLFYQISDGSWRKWACCLVPSSIQGLGGVGWVCVFLVLKEDDEVPQCYICIIILHKLFSNFSRRCLNLQQQLFNLLVQSMFLNPKVIRSQNFEATESAVGHLYVLVHATWAQQSGIEPILVIRRQHYDSLVSAARPQPIYQVQHSREINLFVGYF